MGAASLLLALGSAAGIVVRVVFGHLSNRLNSGRLRLVAGMLGVRIVGFVLLASGSAPLLMVGFTVAFATGWGWPGLFIFAAVKSNPEESAATTSI